MLWGSPDCMDEKKYNQNNSKSLVWVSIYLMADLDIMEIAVNSSIYCAGMAVDTGNKFEWTTKGPI